MAAQNDFDENAGGNVPSTSTGNGGTTIRRLDRIETTLGSVQENANEGLLQAREAVVQAREAVVQAKEAVVQAKEAATVTRETSKELTALHKGGTLVAIQTAAELKLLKVALVGGRDSLIPNDVGAVGRLTEKIDTYISTASNSVISKRNLILSALGISVMLLGVISGVIWNFISLHG
jgi:hypothetical protein